MRGGSSPAVENRLTTDGRPLPKDGSADGSPPAAVEPPLAMWHKRFADRFNFFFLAFIISRFSSASDHEQVCCVFYVRQNGVTNNIRPTQKCDIVSKLRTQAPATCCCCDSLLMRQGYHQQGKSLLVSHCKVRAAGDLARRAIDEHDVAMTLEHISPVNAVCNGALVSSVRLRKLRIVECSTPQPISPQGGVTQRSQLGMQHVHQRVFLEPPRIVYGLIPSFSLRPLCVPGQSNP